MSQLTVAVDARLLGGTSTGDSTYWTCLVEALARIESDFQLLLFTNAPARENIPNSDRIRWVHLPARSSRWWSYVRFPLAARQAGASALHTQYTLSPLAGRNAITTIHDVSFFVEPRWFRGRDRLLLRSAIPASARRAAAIITVSSTSKREIERFVPASEGKVRAIYNACPPWVKPLGRDDAKQVVRDRFSIETPYLLTVGTRWPRKNVALATEAFAIASENMPHQLVITGKTGWGEERLGDRVKVTGYVSQGDLSALYSAADLFLIPSFHEGFGIPMLEAWRCKTPVLCSSGGALPEVAGDAAVVETSWRADDWAATIKALLGDEGKLKLMQDRGAHREKQFTWEQAAIETLALYREVASGRA